MEGACSRRRVHFALSCPGSVANAVLKEKTCSFFSKNHSARLRKMVCNALPFVQRRSLMASLFLLIDLIEERGLPLRFDPFLLIAL
jgi:hypothetical protein